MYQTERMPERMAEQFAEANNLGAILWAYVTPWGILVGYPNGTSRIVGTPTPAAAPMPLKRKHRSP